MRLTTLSLTLAAVGLLAAATAGRAEQALPAAGDEAQLIAKLQSDAPIFDKAKACQTLAVIGTKDCVPVLAGLLGDEKMGHYARFALEPIPDPAVDAALREALGKLEGGLLVGAINSIGVRRDAEAVGVLKQLSGSSDAEVADASLAALGQIATPEAVAAVQGALAGPQRAAAADAVFAAAEKLLADGKSAEAAALCDAVRQADVADHLRIAALHGAIRARQSKDLSLLAECLKSDVPAEFATGLRMAHELGGKAVAELLVARLEIPSSEEEASQGATVIVSAEYGAGDQRVDATEQARAAAASGQPIVASNNLAGDPAPSVKKSLRLVYTTGGTQHVAEIAEGEQVALEGVAAAKSYPRQVRLIHTLGDIRQASAVPAILEAAEKGPLDIRCAAVRVLGEMNDARAVPSLLATAVSKSSLSREAQQSLVELEGRAVDQAIVDALGKAEGQRQAVLIRLVGQRGIKAAVPSLKAAAGAEDEQTAMAAIHALGTTVGLDQLNVLIELLIQPHTPKHAAAAKDALKKAVLRMPSRDATVKKLLAPMEKAPTAVKVDLLDLLGVVGGEKALEAIATAARHGDETLVDAATRLLGNWMSVDAAPVLLELATTLDNQKFRIRALRGYIRIPRQLNVPTDQRVAMCEKALDAADRDAEKELVLEVLGRYPTPKSLELVVPSLDDPKLKGPASEAAVAIAAKVVGQQPALVAEAMKKAAAAAPNAKVAGQAKALLEKAEAGRK